jgi:hypothetical protein
MMTGKPNPDYTQLTLDFGSYVQVFEDNTPRNSTTSRCTGAIALNPTGNISCDYYFMSLETDRRLARRQWTVIPTTDEIITILHETAQRDKQCDISDGSPIFEWNTNIIIDDTLDHDIDTEEDTIDNDADTGIDTEEDAVYQYASNNQDAITPIDDVDDELDHDEPEELDYDAPEEMDYDEPEDVVDNNPDDTPNKNTHEAHHDDEDAPNQPETNDGTILADNTDVSITTTAPRYNLRTNRTRDYSHRFDAYLLHVTRQKGKHAPICSRLCYDPN